MFNEESITPLSRALANLASDMLAAESRHTLEKIINQLFLDITAGSSCTSLQYLSVELKLSNTDILALLEHSKLATIFTDIPSTLTATPISVINTDSGYLLYISKYLQYEMDIAYLVKALGVEPTVINADKLSACIDILSHLNQQQDLPNSAQLAAISTSIKHKLSFITGGPGTGKTTTITLLLWLIYQLYGNDIKVHICAPTGKAAVRVKDAMNTMVGYLEQQRMLDCSALNKLLSTGDSFSTIHKLLGYIPHSIHFKHGVKNRLNLDILIVDESSMIGLALYAKLLQAIDIANIKHIIFIGDKNQLSSVEEGYVFHSLVDNNTRMKAGYQVCELVESKRSGLDIAVLAGAILQHDNAVMTSIFNDSAVIKLVTPSPAHILQRVLPAVFRYIDDVLNLVEHSLGGQTVTDWAMLAQQVFKRFNGQSILCLTNVGLLGTYAISAQIEQQVKLHLKTNMTWYSGRPVIILENDYTLELYNGDIGICVLTRGNKVNVLFANGRVFIPESLPRHQLAYSLSIHKAQGSEYNHVNLVLLPLNNYIDDSSTQSSELYHRALLYTAVTRARESLSIFSDVATLNYMAANAIERNTGLPQLISTFSDCGL